MTCKELAELMAEYLLEELEQLETEICCEMKSHLQSCPHCGTYYATYRVTIEISHKLPHRPLPQDFAKRLLESIKDIEEG